MVEKLISFFLFQIAWFVAVLGGAHDLDFVASCPALALFAFHILNNHQRWFEATASIATIFAMGVLIEIILLKSGVITYHGLTSSTSFPPLWILALWLAFATLPDGALAWLEGRIVLQIVFGALGGPLSYVAGEKLGAVQLNPSFTYAMVVLAVAWIIATPACFKLVGIFSKSAEPLKAV